VAVGLPRRDDDGRRAVAERVDDEVRDDAVEHDRVDVRLELVVDLEREVGVGVEVEDAVEPVRDPHPLRVDLDCVRLEAGEVEQLLDQLREPGALLVDRLLEHLHLLGAQLVPPAVQRDGGSVHRGRGRAQLVRGDRDELVANGVELTELLVEERALDAEGTALRGPLHQLDVLGREAPRRQRPDVDDAEHAAAREQRHAEERLDPLLAQDRVQHVGVVDVLDHDRRPLSGDAAGEAATHRDPHPALDLLLDPLRRARHELASRLVEHQERGRVGLEDVADPEEQLVEERIQRQVRERRIGDEQELVQPLGRRLLRLEEALVLDRERRALGHPLEQLDVVRREGAVRERPHVDDSDYLVAHDQGSPEQ
jgi:hypothetical protein